MYVVAVTIFVKSDRLQQFIQATLVNASNTRREPGNLRFDVLQAEDQPTRFLLYEAYLSKDDFTRHHQTEHYLRWKQTVEAHMAQPRQGIKHQSLYFGDDSSPSPSTPAVPSPSTLAVPTPTIPSPSTRGEGQGEGLC